MLGRFKEQAAVVTDLISRLFKGHESHFQSQPRALGASCNLQKVAARRANVAKTAGY